MQDTYLYTTETVYKNGEQVGHTELYAPKVYGGSFLGMIVNGMLISGRKRNGEFVSEEYHGCCIYTPTSEMLIAQHNRFNRDEGKTTADLKIICETKGYATVKDACREENQIGSTDVKDWLQAYQGEVRSSATRVGHQNKQADIATAAQHTRV